MKGLPLDLKLIWQFKQAGSGFSGEMAFEKIALAILYHFDGREITVFDIDHKQKYFRIGPEGRHTIAGVHVHLPRLLLDPAKAKGHDGGPLKLENKAVGLVGDDRRPGTVIDYIGVLLKALERDEYDVGIVKKG